LTPGEALDRARRAGALAAERERAAVDARRRVRAHDLIAAEVRSAESRAERLRADERRAAEVEGPVSEARREVREHLAAAYALVDFWGRLAARGLSYAWANGHAIDAPGARAAARDQVQARRREICLAALEAARDRALEILLEIAAEGRAAPR
jgi:hypothetical protein